VILQDSIDELDGLIVELTELRQALCRAELQGNPEDALWDVDLGLQHVAARADARAATVRRAIQLLRQSRAS
jgi:hypothetical protein